MRACSLRLIFCFQYLQRIKEASTGNSLVLLDEVSISLTFPWYSVSVCCCRSVLSTNGEVEPMAR